MTENYSTNGDALSRQVSVSQITVNTLEGYRDFFRINSNKETGWVKLKLNKKDPWERKFITFEDGVLSYANDRNSAAIIHIPMMSVISLRSEEKQGNPTIEISTTSSKFYLGFETIEQMRSMLFCFQKSVALVLTEILKSKNDSSDELRISTGSEKKAVADPEDVVWTKELGFGHGRHLPVANRKYGFLDSPIGMGVRARTMEDFDPTYINRDYRSSTNLSRLSVDSPISTSYTAENLPINHSEPIMISMSPAIPIMFRQKDQENDNLYRGEKLAGSYVEPVAESTKLENIARSLGLSGSEGDESSDGDLEESDQSDTGDNESYMMFELDETLENKVETPRSRSRSVNSTTPNRRSFTNASPSASGLADILVHTMTDGFGGNASACTSNGNDSDSGNADSGAASLKQSNVPNPLAITSEMLATVGGYQSLMWTCGSHTKIGPRDKNEDRFVVIPNVSPTTVPGIVNIEIVGDHHSVNSTHLNGISKRRGSRILAPTSTGYFAVFDGHCGYQAAAYLAENLLDNISRQPTFATDIHTAISVACKETDQEFLALCRRKAIYPGTTAIGAFIVKSTLTVFNIGDSQAVLCSNGKAVEVSIPHKPGRPDEAERIRQCNGWITEEKELYMGRLHRMDLSDPMIRDNAKNVTFVTINRVCGELAVSRSIGDPDYKGIIPGEKTELYFCWPENHSEVFMADLVIPDPEFHQLEITDKDEFLILASDGLWDVVSTDLAVQRAKEAFVMHKTPDEAAEELCELALKLGSSDNVTIVVVQFTHSK